MAHILWNIDFVLKEKFRKKKIVLITAILSSFRLKFHHSCLESWVINYPLLTLVMIHLFKLGHLKMICRWEENSN